MADQLSYMKQKRKTIGKEIEDLQNTYKSLDRRIEVIENEMIILASQPINENVIELKMIPERKIYSIRKQNARANLSTYTLYFNELIQSAKKENLIPSTHLIMIHHHIDVNKPPSMLEKQQARKDQEVGFLTQGDTFKQSGSTLIGGLYLSITRRGMAGKDKFLELYTMIHEWLHNNQYLAAGPLIDVLLTDLSNMQPDYVVENILTEVQIRIEKKL